ncbi:hypothetical protein, partial [Rhodoblastus sp.]|uniref:hypothetical protein n=1 Tax=Rhodoblastus sp. TaxID=1962975 RepID=UPI0026312B79
MRDDADFPSRQVQAEQSKKVRVQACKIRAVCSGYVQVAAILQVAKSQVAFRFAIAAPRHFLT